MANLNAVSEPACVPVCKHRNIAFIHGERTAVTEAAAPPALQDLLRLTTAGARTPMCAKALTTTATAANASPAELLTLPPLAHMHLFTDDLSRLWCDLLPPSARAGLRSAGRHLRRRL